MPAFLVRRVAPSVGTPLPAHYQPPTPRAAKPKPRQVWASSGIAPSGAGGGGSAFYPGTTNYPATTRYPGS